MATSFSSAAREILVLFLCVFVCLCIFTFGFVTVLVFCVSMVWVGGMTIDYECPLIMGRWVSMIRVCDHDLYFCLSSCLPGRVACLLSLLLLLRLQLHRLFTFAYCIDFFLIDCCLFYRLTPSLCYHLLRAVMRQCTAHIPVRVHRLVVLASICILLRPTGSSLEETSIYLRTDFSSPKCWTAP